MDRESLGWGPSKGLHGRNHTHLEKVHGETPAERRRARKHKRPRATLDVFIRDGYACRKCGYTAPLFWLQQAPRYDRRDTYCLTVDHVIPSCCGGSDEPFNLVTLCRSCNTRRGAYLPNPVSLV